MEITEFNPDEFQQLPEGYLEEDESGTEDLQLGDRQSLKNSRSE